MVQYWVMVGDERIWIHIGVYELGEATLPERFSSWEYSDEELIAAADNCYQDYASTNGVSPPTVGQAITTEPQREPWGDIMLPAAEVPASSAFYAVTLYNLTETAGSLPPDTPLVDMRPEGWANATAFWVVDSKFLVALSINRDLDAYDTLGDALESFHLAEIVDLTTKHVRKHGDEALELPVTSQTAVPGPPEWRFEDK
jgi:hypothetical protein